MNVVEYCNIIILWCRCGLSIVSLLAAAVVLIMQYSTQYCYHVRAIFEDRSSVMHVDEGQTFYSAGWSVENNTSMTINDRDFIELFIEILLLQLLLQIHHMQDQLLRIRSIIFR